MGGYRVVTEADRQAFRRPKAVLEQKLKLRDLVTRITPKNRHDAHDWGKPMGREVW